ncbi:hypothetical protein MesoLj113a_38510 [Mesorhizobium sp. 113-1-2]|uniref:hypothetical protein n=1 Tax=Mesorhizobium sp. 113-1-2 TaxID=2744515 RepID=UPI0019252D91|nr:hypothetical protein [Mesorhizobium sp. 113-1-2]BCG72693.1 hypothetical protein MesoLj113a_38510 [Mesorhizobium sp. 113-1-2]
MLARFKPTQAEASYFSSVLKLPKPTKEYLAAERDALQAAADLRTLSGRREKMKHEVGIDNPIKNRIPTENFHDALDKLAVDIAAAQVRESQASSEFTRLKAEYLDSVRETLADDIEGLGNAITGHLDQAQELLNIAASLGAEARERHVEMPGIVKDAAAAKHLIESVAFSTIRKMTKGAAR